MDVERGFFLGGLRGLVTGTVTLCQLLGARNLVLLPINKPIHCMEHQSDLKLGNSREINIYAKDSPDQVVGTSYANNAVSGANSFV